MMDAVEVYAVEYRAAGVAAAVGATSFCRLFTSAAWMMSTLSVLLVKVGNGILNFSYG